MERWANKVALVTGGASGIGAQMCKDLCAHKVFVVALDFKEEYLKKLSGEILLANPSAKFGTVMCNLLKEEEIKVTFEKVIKEYGGIDILINCAGIYRDHAILDEDSDQNIHDTIQTNLLAVISCAKKAYKSMSDRGVEGHIVNICSVAGHLTLGSLERTLKPTFSSYTVSKWAVKALTRMLVQEVQYFQKKNFRMSNISPGFVGKTDIAKETDLEECIENMSTLNPKDISDAMIYIISAPGHVQVRDMIIEVTGGSLY